MLEPTIREHLLLNPPNETFEEYVADASDSTCRDDLFAYGAQNCADNLLWVGCHQGMTMTASIENDKQHGNHARDHMFYFLPMSRYQRIDWFD